LAERVTASGAALVPELPDGDEFAIEAPEISAPPSRALSILVAEDNEINALLIRSLLVRIGHRPVVTTDGEQALESWLAADSAGTPYDVVLMDIQMPKLDGITAAKRIRSHETDRGSRRTTILALTANILVDDRYACFEAGMDGFLVKPLDRDKLTEALAAIPASRTVAA
jgi:CheY-like chemotaxis protein